MESTIAVLAPHVIDQIAAGEVIERPASVVKELVDNAIDAGAQAISVEVAGGGRTLVRVSDDGCGMAAKDAVLALERHATSKLRQLDDLWELGTLGFRGEALPSIASVSRMTLTTRRTSDDAATRIAIDAGRLDSVSEAGAPVGTTIEVADLLYNVPARLKFLKGDATEASHITELIAKIAMAYPRLHLRLRHNGRTALDVPPDRDGFARAQALLGPRIAARLVPVSGEESGVRVTAYLGAPELAQTTARGVQLFVGRRPVRDRGLLHALAMGYGELVPRGRYPIAVVLVDVPAGAVDVNVHPQKLEVRFSDAAVVAAAVRHVIQAGVHAARWREEAGGAGPVQMIASVAAPTLPFDGRAATRLAERHVAEMRSRQVSLGFASSFDTGLDHPRDAGPPRRVHAPSPQGALGLAPSDLGLVAQLRSSAASAGPASAGSASAGLASAGSTETRPTTPGSSISPRDWARALREQTQASRAAEPAAVYEVAQPSTRDPGPHPLALASEVLDRGSPTANDAYDILAGRELAPAGHPPTARRLDDAHGVVAAHEPGDDRIARGAEPFDSPGEHDPLASGTRPVPVPRFFAQLRYLGQLDLTYLVCEGDGELVLIDQHAAHERVELARLRDRHASGGGDGRVAVQNMLFPVTLDATPAQLELVTRVGGLLSQVGFEVEPFGKATLAVKAVPAGIRHGDPAQLLRALLHEWATSGAPSEAERLDALLGEIACHSVVRAGDRLTPSEADTLLRSLDGVDLSLPAPHGRAVLLRLPLAEIGRRFGR
ncbi:MAG TPA: DNA mismatch repair endonuclease MutL [Kofleriaceae bacterium]|nr:DNA mismatch repair endonuclease MutL [Kofleriaceae bacterium]